jgi:hypothetical protein
MGGSSRRQPAASGPVRVTAGQVESTSLHEPIGADALAREVRAALDR